MLLFAFLCLITAKVNAQSTSFTPEGLAEKMLTLNEEHINFQDILKKYEGKTIVIDVWASWCKDCITSMPKVKALQKKFKKNIVYLSVSMDKTPEAWKKGIKKYDIKGEHYLVSDGMKGVFGKSITLDWIPRYMVVDKKGKIVLYKAIHADDEKLIATLKNNK